jgi:hypothetical protein
VIFRQRPVAATSNVRFLSDATIRRGYAALRVFPGRRYAILERFAPRGKTILRRSSGEADA